MDQYDNECEKCQGDGYVCGKCKEGDSNCPCPFNGGKRPAVIRCPDCGGKNLDAKKK